MNEIETIRNERKNSSFDVNKMKLLLEGSEESLQKQGLAFQILERDPYLIKKDFFDINTKENLELTTIQMRRYAEVKESLKNDPLLQQRFEYAIHNYDRSLGMKSN